ncbi:MAG TPA: hypothetical protein VM582_04285 [Candidatus Thermoplasmatota archaeon]|nr:hypothetical protein [Candidatus Thermoplasmatota archaeon]
MIALLVLALAGVAWVVAGVAYDIDPLGLLGLLVLAGALALAWLGARSQRRALHAGGLALAVLGMLLFLGEELGSVEGAATTASHLFTLALAGAAAAAWLGHAPLARGAWALAALAALLWVYADRDAWAWQVGNVAALVGAAWLAARPSA